MFRKTDSYLAPLKKNDTSAGAYDLFPAFPVAEPIYTGIDQLAEKIRNEKTVIIEGSEGVLWTMFIQSLCSELEKSDR